MKSSKNNTSDDLDFLQLRTQFEKFMPAGFELLEMHYAPYSFGSGFCAYRLHGRNLLLIYSGKDLTAELHASEPHETYPSKVWTKLLEEPATSFTEKAIDAVSNLYS